MLTLFFSFILIGTIKIFAQIPLMIEKTSSDILLSFHQKKSLPVYELESLNRILNSEVDDTDFVIEYSTTEDAYDSLINHFIMFESECKNVSSDSALFLFNQWYLHFSNTFYNYYKKKFFLLPRTKIIFFSTSMSCHCTLEMCRNQLIDILKFLSQKRDCPCSGKRINMEEYNLFVVDAYENNELQIKYQTFFSPSVVVLDGNNKVLIKIEYEENMIDQLKNYLRGEI